MCDSLSRRLSAKDFLLLGSVFVDGFRAADLSRQSARYRSLPPFDAGQAVPHGISRQGGALHSRRCQRVARLANLRRFCSGVDRDCATIVCPRSHGRGSGTQSIRVGLDYHRSLSIAFSLGPVSPAQSRREDAHTARPARQYPHVYPHHRRQSTRRQHPRRDRSRSRRVLCHGSRLHRFRSPLLLHTLLGIFRPAYQRECLTATSLFPSGRPQHRRALRSHRHLDRYRIRQGLSGCTATGELPGRGNQQASEVSKPTTLSFRH